MSDVYEEAEYAEDLPVTNRASPINMRNRFRIPKVTKIPSLNSSNISKDTYDYEILLSQISPKTTKMSFTSEVLKENPKKYSKNTVKNVVDRLYYDKNARFAKILNKNTSEYKKSNTNSSSKANTQRIFDISSIHSRSPDISHNISADISNSSKKMSKNISYVGIKSPENKPKMKRNMSVKTIQHKKPIDYYKDMSVDKKPDKQQINKHEKPAYLRLYEDSINRRLSIKPIPLSNY